MKKFQLLFAVLITTIFANAQEGSWKIVPGRITTQWADSVNPKNILPEYPRPQMQRSDWQSLNGLWQYTILAKSDAEDIPASFQGNILVPFAIESALSGVEKTVGKDSILWYQRTITVPGKRKDKKILLHFGAVDWRSDIYLNGNKIGSHEGGYDPFTIDITGALKKGKQQQLAVRVWDPTDDGPQPHGKQVVKPGGIWYTSVTGIWQTVWLEAVPDTYISSTKQTPDIDKQIVTVSADIAKPQAGDVVKISVWDGSTMVSEKETLGGVNAVLQVINPKLWSPDNPFLYDLKVSVIRKGKVIDEVKSYFAMRKISMKPDDK